METRPRAVIVGAGLAGLSCAVELSTSGVDCRAMEASDEVGGRVRTDVVDGFRLDCGFQVLLTAYPEARQLLDQGAPDFDPEPRPPRVNGMYVRGDHRADESINGAMASGHAAAHAPLDDLFVAIR